MSRRRKSNETPLSLFSFQDVITGITGIMILLVLMMVLDMVANPPTPQPIAVSPKQIKIAEMEKAKQKLLGAITGIDEKLAQFPKTSVWEVKREIKDAIAVKAGLIEKTKKLRPVIQDITQAIADADKKKKEIDALVGKLQSTQNQLNNRLDKIKKEHLIIFVPSNTQKTPIVVNCSGKSILVQVLGPNRETQNFPFAGNTSFQQALNKFFAWARTRDKNKEAFCIILKPSAGRFAMHIVGKLSGKKEHNGLEFDVGYEPLEEEKTSLFKEDVLP